ncbi:MAG: hypothetical protein HYT98_04985 [Candidatus Sungbacteria bacterium]|nr:hypothetical protein [Candidatus Sungbacteria bacterium]
MSYFAHLSKEEKLLMWREMCRSRFIELKIRYDIKDSGDSHIPTVALLSLGEEAVSLGASFACNPSRDWLVPGHRSKGALVHFGVTPEEDLANHLCKADSPSRGRDGNIHYGLIKKHILKFKSHMISNWPTGAGIADALTYIFKLEKQEGKLPVVLCFCGDGASRQGTFHEVLNYAAVRNLPMGFIIDNNRIATDTPFIEQSAAQNLVDIARGYNIEGAYIANGNDIVTVYNYSVRLIERARTLANNTKYLSAYNLARAPFILECDTFRMAEHNESRKANCVDIFDFIEWGALDPVRLFREELLGLRSVDAVRAIHDREPGKMFACDVMEISEAELNIIAEEEKQAVDAAYEAVRTGPDPEPDESLLRIFPHVAINKVKRSVEPFDAKYALRTKLSPEEHKNMLSYGVAIRKTLHDILKNNRRVRIFGEDVGGCLIEGEPRGGGVYGITHDIVADLELEVDQCFNTPLAEIAIVGAATGHAIAGLIPIAEIQYLPFASCAMQQIIDYLASFFWTTGVSPHVLFRLPSGGGKSMGEYHSSLRLEAAFFHTPGLKMVHPSTPHDAAALLRASVLDDAPILFFEDLWAYSSVFGKVGDGEVAIGSAALRQEGSDLTIISWGARMWFQVVLPAVDILAQEGISLELIDLRSLCPLDLDLLVESAVKTRRVLIAHEAPKYGGVGGSIAQMIQEAAGENLLAPYIGVVGAKRCMLAQHPKLEEWILPSDGDILAVARELLAYR